MSTVKWLRIKYADCPSATKGRKSAILHKILESLVPSYIFLSISIRFSFSALYLMSNWGQHFAHWNLIRVEIFPWGGTKTEPAARVHTKVFPYQNNNPFVSENKSPKIHKPRIIKSPLKSQYPSWIQGALSTASSSSSGHRTLANFGLKNCRIAGHSSATRRTFRSSGSNWVKTSTATGGVAGVWFYRFSGSAAKRHNSRYNLTNEQDGLKGLNRSGKKL